MLTLCVLLHAAEDARGERLAEADLRLVPVTNDEVMSVVTCVMSACLRQILEVAREGSPEAWSAARRR